MAGGTAEVLNFLPGMTTFYFYFTFSLPPLRSLESLSRGGAIGLLLSSSPHSLRLTGRIDFKKKKKTPFVLPDITDQFSRF